MNIPHFSTGLRWALTDTVLPASQRSPRAGPKTLIVATILLAAWVAVAGSTLSLLVFSEGPDPSGTDRTATETLVGKNAGIDAFSRDDGSVVRRVGPSVRFALDVPIMAWRVAMSVIAVGVFLWLIESVVRLFRYAILFGGRIEREPVSPNPATAGLWARQSALMKHVTAMSKLNWQWTRASPGNLLVRQGDRDRTFHWIASGEAKVVSRDAAGNLRKLATLSGGSGVGEVALLEDQPRTADVVVTQTALVISLSYEDFDVGLAEGDRERFRDVVFAGRSFSGSSVFRGCPAPDKERWIRGGTPRRLRPGDTIIAEGEVGRWMALVVEGSVDVLRAKSRVAELGPGSVFGETSFLYETTRNASLIAKSDVLLWCWEPEWLEEEVVRTGLRSELEALATERETLAG